MLARNMNSSARGVQSGGAGLSVFQSIVISNVLYDLSV